VKFAYARVLTYNEQTRREASLARQPGERSCRRAGRFEAMRQGMLWLSIGPQIVRSSNRTCGVFPANGGEG